MKSYGGVRGGGFQFLIGRLGTGSEKAQIHRALQFQFLIGRLGTRKRYSRESEREEKFQFLIGRLGTGLQELN